MFNTKTNLSRWIRTTLMNACIPKEQLDLKPEGIYELIYYNGWTIYGWTGWKGTKSKFGVNSKKYNASWGDLTVDEFNDAGTKNPCLVCGNPAKYGDLVIISQGTRAINHYACVNGDKPDRHMGQWLASKWTGDKWQYAGVNVDNLVVDKLIGSEYRKGDSFEVSIDGEFITEDTSYALKIIAKEDGLSKMYEVIDEINEREKTSN